jgi:hypothetical protein
MGETGGMVAFLPPGCIRQGLRDFGKIYLKDFTTQSV